MTTNTNGTAGTEAGIDLDKLEEISARILARGFFNASCDIQEWIAETRKALARRAPAPADERAERYPLTEYQPGQWWLQSLDALAGHGTVDDDTRRAAGIACNFAAAVFAHQAAPKPRGWLTGSGTAMAEDMYYKLEDAQEECERHNDYERSRPDFEEGDLRKPEPVYSEPIAAPTSDQQAGAGARFLNAEELAALHRFDECAQDGEGYDVPKEMMQRLAEIGVVRRKSGAHYEATDFGQHVLGNAPAEAGMPNVKELVNRFLAWPMPDSLSARIAPNVTKPIGTHLMNADEAKAMFEHCLAAPAAIEQAGAQPVAQAGKDISHGE